MPFSGVSAVMVFFVVSGFCIHYPYASGRSFQLAPFYLQRLMRIALPLLVAAGVHYYAGTLPWLKNVLWAVYCEVIFYALYPLLRAVLRGNRAYRCLLGTFVVSWLFCLWPDDGYGHIMAYGDGWTWLVCLPVWICGCVLANWLAGSMAIPGVVLRMAKIIENHPGVVRCALWLLSSFLLVLGIREIVWFKYSLPASGLLVLVWLLASAHQWRVLGVSIGPGGLLHLSDASFGRASSALANLRLQSRRVLVAATAGDRPCLSPFLLCRGTPLASSRAAIWKGAEEPGSMMSCGQPCLPSFLRPQRDVVREPAK